MVERALAEYSSLSECVAVLSLSDAPPKLVARATAAATLADEGFPKFIFDIDLRDIDDEDELALVAIVDNVPWAEKLRVDRGAGRGPATPTKIPPFSKATVDDELIRRIADTIGSLQEQVRSHVQVISDEPGAFMIFWSIFDASPVLIVREAAKATLGDHPMWKQMLPHIYTPCDDVLVLAEMNGRLVPFVRDSVSSSTEPRVATRTTPHDDPVSAKRPKGPLTLVADASTSDMSTKKSKPKSEVERYARRFLKMVVETCAREHTVPGDRFLMIGKYDPERAVLVPRAIADETVTVARSSVGREKMTRFLAKPCEPKQLLVLITAGDHVEGQFIRVPTIAPDPDKITVTRAEMDDIERYMQAYGPSFSAAVAAKGGKLSDYVAILRPPDKTPIFGTRENARATLELEENGMRDVVKELEVPAKNDDELLCVYKVKGKPTWSRLQYPPGAEHGE